MRVRILKDTLPSALADHDGRPLWPKVWNPFFPEIHTCNHQGYASYWARYWERRGQRKYLSKKKSSSKWLLEQLHRIMNLRWPTTVCARKRRKERESKICFELNPHNSNFFFLYLFSRINNNKKNIPLSFFFLMMLWRRTCDLNRKF